MQIVIMKPRKIKGFSGMPNKQSIMAGINLFFFFIFWPGVKNRIYYQNKFLILPKKALKYILTFQVLLGIVLYK
jgi:hypothetical protein